ncbi:MAG: hypothetical protein JST00_17470 [Deltaproteobacteria bacterium]|nr:hypothetical protein [Deltaproteobacteria bacterium]
MSGGRPGPARLASLFAASAIAVLGTFAGAGCAANGAPPTVPTLTVPVMPVTGRPLDVGGAGRKPSPVAIDGRSAGDPVDVEWHGSWYPAVLLERRAEGWLVHYEGYDDTFDEIATFSRIRDRSASEEEEPSVDVSDP